MVKTFKNLFLQNWKFYDLEIWHAVSGTEALQSLYNWRTWVDHYLFYGKVQFANLGYSIGKKENSGFSETITECDLKVGRCRQLFEFMKVCEY